MMLSLSVPVNLFSKILMDGRTHFMNLNRNFLKISEQKNHFHTQALLK